MTTDAWPALISALSGLSGVTLGASLTARVQPKLWARGKQVDACAAIVAESTRIQLAMRRWWKDGDRIDWVAWNQALAEISLMSEAAVVEAAGAVDEVFWQESDRIERGEVIDETRWFEAAGRMELARLAFVNAAKRHVMGSAKRLDSLPIRRPRHYMPGVPSGGLPPTATS
jgi:hypothetical protein